MNTHLELNGSSLDIAAASLALETETIEAEALGPPVLISLENPDNLDCVCDMRELTVEPHSDDLEDQVGEAGVI